MTKRTSQEFVLKCRPLTPQEKQIINTRMFQCEIIEQEDFVYLRFQRDHESYGKSVLLAKLQLRRLGIPVSDYYNPEYIEIKKIKNNGKATPNSKLTLDDVKYIRGHKDEFTYAHFAKFFKVSVSTIKDLLANKTWQVEK